MDEPTTLFRAEWGSRAYGTHTETSDRDLISVQIETPRFVTGLDEFRPKHTTTAADGERSSAEDTDTVTYGLKKYAALCVEGNPQVLATLFLTDFIEYNPMFKLLQDSRHTTVSKQAGRKYLGYMSSQRLRITGEKSRSTNRPELIELYSWDVKFGMHMIRLGFQGIELLSTGNIKLPMEGEPLQICRNIREGKVSKEEGLALSYDLEERLRTLIESDNLPERGDRARMSSLLHDIYLEVWTSK